MEAKSINKGRKMAWRAKERIRMGPSSKTPERRTNERTIAELLFRFKLAESLGQGLVCFMIIRTERERLKKQCSVFFVSFSVCFLPFSFLWGVAAGCR